MTTQANSNQVPEGCAFVIFGVTGDLTHRLVIPALYNLAEAKLLPEKFCVVGVTRKEMSSDGLRDSLMQGLRKYATRPVDDKVADQLLYCVTAVSADPSEPQSFDQLRERLEKLEANRNTGGNRLFYLATRRMRSLRLRPNSAAPDCSKKRAAPGAGWWSRSRSVPTSPRPRR